MYLDITLTLQVHIHEHTKTTWVLRDLQPLNHMEKKAFPHHACDFALFTLSWRVGLFDQAGEALGWMVVLTKSQCAVCRQGNFPG